MHAARILVVEDDPEMLESVRDILRRAGHQVTTAVTGQDALDRLLREQEPEAIVLDIRMPVMDGRELLNIARSYRRLATIPVIVLTAAQQQPDWLGSADILMRKPFRVDDLLANVETLIGRGASRVAP